MLSPRFFARLAPLALVSGSILSGLIAQDPKAPPGGFAIEYLKDNPITYSDGYKTLLDIRYPKTTTTPTTGWPAAMIVHGGGGHRKKGWVVTLCEQLARAGYVTLAYDTGGHGVTQVLNPPGQRAERRRMTDLAEIFYLAEQRLGVRMDSSRLAVTGKSGGGKHTLWATSWSGRTLLVPGYVKTMPKISAAHSDIQCLDLIEDNLPAGNMIKSSWAVSMFEGKGPTDPVTQMMIAADYAKLHAFLLAEPGLNFLPLLKTSDVPLCVSYAYDDVKHFVNTNADTFPVLKTGVPRRYYQGTGGHASASNNIEAALRRDFTRRWFDRFLKNIKNRVDEEPFAEIAVLPSSPSDYNDPKSEWVHRRSPVWPIRPGKRLYLRKNGALLPAAPSGIEAAPTLKHRVAAGYGMLQFMQHKARPASVVTKIPLVTVAFQTGAFQEPQELLGRTVVEFDVVNSGATDFQIQAALLDVTPSGGTRFITSGVTAKRKAVPGRHRMRIEIGDVGYVLAKGHKLRLSIENMNLRRHPGNAHFLASPDFANCDLTVQIDPAFAPRIDLPLQPAKPSLTPRFGRVSAGAGFRYPLHVRGESARAGAIYQVFLGGSGNTPGVNVPPRVPLNVDILTSIGASFVNTPIFQDFLGKLDANGNRKATFALPAPLANAIVGTRINFVAVGLEKNGTYWTSAPAELIIEP